MCLSYENGRIPGNLHYKEPNPQNESLKAGILQVCAPASMPALLPYHPDTQIGLSLVQRCLSP